ncbi:uncharacterized protein LOC110183110 [Drosophila serrata]|uniref:uncharacterized protein LOC110183110 n=1 Tax=Drosophila serrata TaxID=7274 RepID=UPI000A1D0B62|nr:uncharacterized protein LOC110183110 [Drosophila serrata]
MIASTIFILTCIHFFIQLIFTANISTLPESSAGFLKQGEGNVKANCLNILNQEVKFLEQHQYCGNFTQKMRRMISTYKRVRKELQTLKESGCQAKKTTPKLRDEDYY